MLERLEGRIVLATAPPSIGGQIIEVTIESATGPFADEGVYQWRPQTATNRFEVKAVSGPTVGGYGRFKYARAGDGSGLLTYSLDDAVGDVFSNELTYETDSSGRYELRGNGGVQRGTFRVVSSSPFVETWVDTLTVTGSPGDDAIHVWMSNGTYRATRNGFTSPIKGDLDEITHIVVDCGSGADRVTVDPLVTASMYISGGGGDDTLTGGSGNDDVFGGGGKNKLSGANGDDRVRGSSGRDFLYGGNGRDRLYGNDGDDYLDGGNQGDRLYGGSGNDFLIGGKSIDRLYGEAGADTLSGGDAADLLDGGDGIDRRNGIVDVLDEVRAIP